MEGFLRDTRRYLKMLNTDAICIALVWRHPAAKGVRQKEFGKKVTKKVTEASEKVTEK